MTVETSYSFPLQDFAGDNMTQLAIVGSGPMALYTLKHLQESPSPLAIEIFESAESAGTGMPYRADMNADYILCNAFSREIPPVTETLIDWLASQPARELNEWELSWHDLSARAFYPRVLIGEFLQSEFENVCEQLRAAGHSVTVRTRHKMRDIVPTPQGFDLHCRVNGVKKSFACDTVIIATGHHWPETNSQVNNRPDILHKLYATNTPVVIRTGVAASPKTPVFITSAVFMFDTLPVPTVPQIVL